MNFAQFLIHTPSLASLMHTNVVHFKGDKSYPLLFFSLLVDRYKQQAAMLVETVDLDTSDSGSIQAKFETNFLGLVSCYWLRSLSDLDAKKRAWWTHYLEQYQGPNLLIFFSDSTHTITLPSTALIIEIPDLVDQKTCAQLMAHYQNKPLQGGAVLVKRIFGKHERIPLDSACVVMHYALLVGGDSQEFMDTWLPVIMVPEQSLFTLSTYFFSKNGRLFFALWSTMIEAYSDMFWVAFWSEQLWRAANFVQLAQGNKLADAKKIGFRLPFSFMQKDWKAFSAQELTNAHNFLYSLDTTLKSGGSVPGLELFYLKFFHHSFRQ